MCTHTAPTTVCPYGPTKSVGYRNYYMQTSGHGWTRAEAFEKCTELSLDHAMFETEEEWAAIKEIAGQ